MPPPSSDPKLGYMNMTINYLYTNTINQFLNKSYTDYKFSNRLLEWTASVLEELNHIVDSSQRYKMYMSLILNQLMVYMNHPDDESIIQDICQAIFNEEAGRAMPLTQLNELRSTLCKHLQHLLNQDFFNEYREMINEIVDDHVTRMFQENPGSHSQISGYSKEQLCLDMQEYVRKYSLDKSSSVMYHLSKHYHQFRGQEGDEDELINNFQPLHQRQREVSEKRKIDSLPTTNSQSSSPAPKTPVVKKARVAAKSPIEPVPLNIKMSPRVETSPGCSSRIDIAPGHSKQKESLTPSSTSRRTALFKDSKKTRIRRIDSEDEPAITNKSNQTDTTELDFGDEEEVERVNKNKNNQLKPIENVTTRGLAKKANQSVGGKKSSPTENTTLSFKRKPATSDGSTSSEDQENQALDPNDDRNKMLVLATTFRQISPVNYAETSDTESDVIKPTTSKKTTSTIKNTGKGRVKWSHLETQYLVLGVTKYGKGNWSRIRDEYKAHFANRDNVAIKDRWRVLEKNPTEMNLYRRKVASHLVNQTPFGDELDVTIDDPNI